MRTFNPRTPNELSSDTENIKSNFSLLLLLFLCFTKFMKSFEK